MKKILTFCLATGLLFMTARAQDTVLDSLSQRISDLEERVTAQEQADSIRAVREHLDKIWKQRKHWTLGIASQKLRDMDDAAAPTLKSDLALSLQWGKTFSLHKRYIANMVKIGMDWNWVDWHYARYKKFDEGDFALSTRAYDWGEEEDASADIGLPDLGYHQIDIGMAVGPSVQVTPLYTLGKGLEYIKVYTFFHATPSFSAVILSGNDKTEFATAYNTFFSWGIGIAYKAFAIGFETRWGSAKYNTSNFDEVLNEGGDLSDISEKTKYKTTTSKFTVSLRF